MGPRAVVVCVRLGLTLLLFAIASGATAAERSLVELLHRAGEYVLAYENEFRVVIAEEVYVQRLRTAPGGPVREIRRLSSDVAFVKVTGTGLPWWLLRDVYQVDGQVVRDRQARLERVLVENPATGLSRARAIADEGARYNLGRSVRNFNVPTLVLAFLHPALQPRFSFEWKGKTTIEGRSFVELAFRERKIPIVAKRNCSERQVSRRRFFVQCHRHLRGVARGRQNLSRCPIRIADVDIGTGQLRPGHGVLWILRDGLAQERDLFFVPLLVGIGAQRAGPKIGIVCARVICGRQTKSLRFARR
jgi:hypothetical protein